LPKKGEKLSEPDDAALGVEVEKKIRKTITTIKDKMNDLIRTERTKLGQSNQENASQ